MSTVQNSFVAFLQHFTIPGHKGSLWDISQSTTTKMVTIPCLLALPTVIFKFLLQNVPCTPDQLFHFVYTMMGDPMRCYNKDNFFMVLKWCWIVAQTCNGTSIVATHKKQSERRYLPLWNGYVDKLMVCLDQANNPVTPTPCHHQHHQPNKQLQ